MRATPGLVGGAGIAAGVMYLLGRQRGKRRHRALPDAANRAARRGVTFLEEHPWGVFGAAASVLTAGTWGLWHRRPRKIRMATTIEAPIERVFDAWSRFEDFPQFMPTVAQVRRVDDDRWQWTISQPDGASIEFLSSVTQRERPHLLAWATDGGAVAKHSGTVRFRPTAESETRMEIEISRRPSAGGDGEGVAMASGVDPKRALRDGLAAFKARLEAAA